MIIKNLNKKKILKHILFIFIIILALISLLDQNIDKIEKTINISLNNKEWTKIISYSNPIVSNDTINICFNTIDKNLFNTPIKIKLVEHKIFENNKEYVETIKPNDIFSRQISSRNKFTIYAISLTESKNLDLNFLISFTKY